MKKYIFAILAFICTLSAEAKNENFICGNGSIVMEMQATAGKEEASFTYKDLYKAFTLLMNEDAAKDMALTARNEDMRTGEITTEWTNEGFAYSRRAFVSRKDSVAIILLTADGKGTINQTFRIASPSNKHSKYDVGIQSKTVAGKDYLNIISTFSKEVFEGETLLNGSEAYVQFVPDNGKMTFDNNGVHVKNCHQLLIYIAISPLSDGKKSNTELLKARINTAMRTGYVKVKDKKSKNLSMLVYEELLHRHVPTHQEVFRENAFMLNTDNEADKQLVDMVNRIHYNSLCGSDIDETETTNFSAIPDVKGLVKSELQASFYYDNYLHTLDTEYLRTKALPYMLNVADQVEKTLRTTDNYGFYVIGKDDPTFEVTATANFLRDLISTCNILMESQERVGNWMNMLAKMPPFRIDINEEFRRNLFSDMTNQPQTDALHLVGLFYRNEPIITRSADLLESCKTTIANTVQYRHRIGQRFDEGLLQLALASAALGEAETCYDLLMESRSAWKMDEKTRQQIAPVITKMLQQSYYAPETGKVYLNLLAATPKSWNKGELRGTLARGGVMIKDLSWDETDSVSATLTAQNDITVDIYIKGSLITTVDLKNSEPYHFTAKRNK